MSDLTIEPYTDKSIAIFGNSLAIKDELGKHCSWNYNLGGRAGWVCSKTKEPIVRQIVENYLSRGPSQQSTLTRTVPRSSTVSSKITAKTFESFADFEIMNLLRNRIDGETLHERRFRALRKLRGEDKLERKLTILTDNPTFKTFYTLSDEELITELATNNTPYVQGMNHFSAAVVESYFADDKLPEEVLDLVKEFLPTFNIKMVESSS
ncbi:Hypothetical protein POVR1_LOCUS530 [uncultured virus]|nr:Hypothetical protein POVR1_LOCUS530 [uncultured virus]